MNNKGKLFLLPTYLDETNGPDVMAPMVGDIIRHIGHFLVENTRTTRRYIGSLQLEVDIGSLVFQVLDKRTSETELQTIMKPLLSGEDMGLLSEAGLPCIADPGRIAVDFAHRNGIDVVPVPGPSSIILALIASGLNGQHFTFHGYLPIEKSQRTKGLLSMQKEAIRSGATQIFMETPYRNNQLMEDLLSQLSGDLLLSVAANVTGKDEFIRTKAIQQWRKDVPDLHKKPTIYCLGVRR